MKLLLTGKNGQVGFELNRALSVLGDVVAVGSSDCDFGDVDAVKVLVERHRPDVIVNPAAYTAVDKAEQEIDRAYAVNAKAPETLAAQATRHNAMLVHFSTDYVFDGDKPDPYVEEDPTNPQCVYGASKLAGEEAVRANCDRHLILRTSWVVSAHGANFAKTMLRLATEREELSVVADQFGAPTSAAMLADLTAHLIRQESLATSGGCSNAEKMAKEGLVNGEMQHNFEYGLYHAVASGQTNWHEYACYVIERARLHGSVLIGGERRQIKVLPEKIRAICSAAFPTPAKRPGNSRLDSRKIVNSFGLHMPSWQDGVDHILDQII